MCDVIISFKLNSFLRNEQQIVCRTQHLARDALSRTRAFDARLLQPASARFLCVIQKSVLVRPTAVSFHLYT